MLPLAELAKTLFAQSLGVDVSCATLLLTPKKPLDGRMYLSTTQSHSLHVPLKLPRDGYELHKLGKLHYITDMHIARSNGVIERIVFTAVFAGFIIKGISIIGYNVSRMSDLLCLASLGNIINDPKAYYVFVAIEGKPQCLLHEACAFLRGVMDAPKAGAIYDCIDCRDDTFDHTGRLISAMQQGLIACNARIINAPLEAHEQIEKLFSVYGAMGPMLI